MSSAKSIYKKIRFSIIDYIIDNAELMSVEANKVIGKFFLFILNVDDKTSCLSIFIKS